MKSFVPNKFKIPEILETRKFRIRMLTVNDVAKDYEAIMKSIDHLQGIFGPNSIWPVSDLTLEEDLISIGLHQKEFQERSSFTYTVMDLEEKKCLGCVYIMPSDSKLYDAMVVMWTRKSELKSGLDKILFSTVKKWISQKWHFKKVAYPGRTMTWDKFLN
jgi:hypothetical protein